MKTVTFSGHRNKVLKWSDVHIHYFKKNILAPELTKLIKEGYLHFIVGGATGFDMWVLELLIMAKKKYPHIFIEVAVPFPNHTQFWSIQEEVEFNKYISQVDSTTIVTERYESSSYQKRNMYMINMSDYLMVLHLPKNKNSGTFNAIKYAKTLKIEIKNLYQIILDKKNKVWYTYFEMEDTNGEKL